MKVKNNHRSKFSNLSNWKEQALKNQGFPLKPWFFQASSFQLLKLEILLRWSFFTFIVFTALGLWNIYHGGTVGNLNCYKASLDALPRAAGDAFLQERPPFVAFRILLMLGRRQWKLTWSPFLKYGKWGILWCITIYIGNDFAIVTEPRK